MKLEDIQKIEQTGNVKEVNNLLDNGWVIIRLFNARIKTAEIENTSPIYVLGKASIGE